MRVPLAIVFFLWIGIFNLMIVAQFWSFANDIYTKDEGRAAVRDRRIRRLAGRGGRLAVRRPPDRAGRRLRAACCVGAGVARHRRC